MTGWKSIFSVGSFPKRINELEAEESADLLKKFYDLILENHDLQVRFKWRNKNDIGELSRRPVWMIFFDCVRAYVCVKMFSG